MEHLSHDKESVIRAQGDLRTALAAVGRWARQNPERFNSVFIEYSDPPRVIANLVGVAAELEKQLKPLLRRPEQVSIRTVSRSRTQVEDLRRRLLSRWSDTPGLYACVPSGAKVRVLIGRDYADLASEITAEYGDDVTVELGQFPDKQVGSVTSPRWPDAGSTSSSGASGAERGGLGGDGLGGPDRDGKPGGFGRPDHVGEPDGPRGVAAGTPDGLDPKARIKLRPMTRAGRLSNPQTSASGRKVSPMVRRGDVIPKTRGPR